MNAPPDNENVVSLKGIGILISPILPDSKNTALVLCIKYLSVVKVTIVSFKILKSTIWSFDLRNDCGPKSILCLTIKLLTL